MTSNRTRASLMLLRRGWRRFASGGLANRMALVLLVASVAAVSATYAALRAGPPFGSDVNTVILLLALDICLMLLLGALIGWRIVLLWQQRRRGQAGSRLHVRLVALFGALAIVPAIVVTLFASVFFYAGVQSWFSDRVHTAVLESSAVAEAYLKEHQESIRADALAMATDIARRAPQLFARRGEMENFMSAQTYVRGLTEVLLMDRNGSVFWGSGLIFLDREPVKPEEFERAESYDTVMLEVESDDRVRALVRVNTLQDLYLVIGRPVEPRVLEHMESTRTAVEAYTQLEDKRLGLQLTVNGIFVVVALLLLLASIWVGLNLANRLATPIAALIDAADRVRSGELGARVVETSNADELSILSRAFNRMTGQLQHQQRELLDANEQLEFRRQFTEAVLAGVSAGVLGLHADGRIYLANRSALELLGAEDADEILGAELTALVPPLVEVLEQVRRRPARVAEAQIQLAQQDGAPPRVLLVRLTAELDDERPRGFVATFDDISELMSAQRKAAWADVARRIAHEIKNPLTPIQLSAERLRRRYLKEITSDPATFQACTDTIIRQVDDIGRMVDEFSAFARMPQPVMKPHSLQELARQALLLQSGRSTVQFSSDMPEAALVAVCDSRQLHQALTNLLQNAVDAIDGREDADAPPGAVVLSLRQQGEEALLSVADNGRGLPQAERDRLTEPYVTTRAKGTGLGLAIVKKIMEDHGGHITLRDREGGGAVVTLVLPLRPAAAQTVPPTLPHTDPQPQMKAQLG